MSDAFTITFWGVRGTVPTPGKHTVRYGGQTSCVQMSCGGRELIFDAGTGLYPLGESLKVQEVDLFLSHTHIDHILGFPFFSGVYDPHYTVRVWAGHLKPESGIREALGMLMQPPLFPLTLDFLKADVQYHDFMAGEELHHPHFAEAGIRIHTLALRHPDRATAYRVDYAGKSACYVTDLEHRDHDIDQALRKFIHKADVLIYDSTFDDQDFSRFAGWGHSTWQHALRLGDAAEVKSVVLFHHDPGASDEILDERQKMLDAMRPGSYVAYEGLKITLRE